MKITAGTKLGRIQNWLHFATGDDFTRNEAELFKKWWIDNIPESVPTEVLTLNTLMGICEKIGI